MARPVRRGFAAREVYAGVGVGIGAGVGGGTGVGIGPEVAPPQNVPVQDQGSPLPGGP